MEAGVLSVAQGANSDHRGIVIDIDLQQMWSAEEEPQQELRPRGFRVNNTLKSRQYVTALFLDLEEREVMEKVAALFERVKSGEYNVEAEQSHLVDLDNSITTAMLQAEDSVRPSSTATSHSWSPELVLLQKKANLLTQAAKCMKLRGRLTENKITSFHTQARNIDPLWSPDFSIPENITIATAEAKKAARAGTRKQKELRKEHLENLLQESTSLGSEEYRERALKTIKRIEAQRQTHRCIKAAFKPRTPPLRHVVQDGTRLAGSEMNQAFLAHNQQHFMQPTRNGSSAAIPGTVRDDLRIFDDNGKITRMDAAFQNYYSILEGDYDLEKVQEEERPFYKNLQRVTQPDDNMARDIKEAELHHYMQKIPERTSSSPSGRHVGLYKALHMCIPDEQAEVMQQSLSKMLLQVINSCLRMSFILPRWQLGTDIMLQKKPGVYNIESMRTIRLLECDLNFLLKIKFAKHAIESIKNRLTGSLLADNQNGFRPKRSTKQAVMCN